MSCPYNHNGYCTYTEFDIDRLNWGCRDDFNQCNYKSAAQVREEEAEDERRRQAAREGKGVYFSGSGMISFVLKAMVAIFLIAVVLGGAIKLVKSGLLALGIIKSSYHVTITDADGKELSQYAVRLVRFLEEEDFSYNAKETSFKKDNAEVEIGVKRGDYDVIWVLKKRLAYVNGGPCHYDGETDYHASFSADQLDDCYLLIEVNDAEGSPIAGEVGCSSTSAMRFTQVRGGVILAAAAQNPGVTEVTISVPGYQDVTVTVDFGKTSFFCLTAEMELAK